MPFFVAAMEDVLEVYHRPYDPQRDSYITSQVLIQHSRLITQTVNEKEDLTRYDGFL
jgi:hypothetical protein